VRIKNTSVLYPHVSYNYEMLNSNQKYFIASFRFDKDKPEDFDLEKIEGTEYCQDKDGGKWKQTYLWDSGWGNEYGFVRQPEPNFEQLWSLLLESNIEDNQLGAAELLDIKYPFELKEKLKDLFSTEMKLNRNITKRLERLEVLRTGTNRSEVIGKSIKTVEIDYQEWKKIKADFDKLKTDSIWNKIFKSS